MIKKLFLGPHHPGDFVFVAIFLWIGSARLVAQALIEYAWLAIAVLLFCPVIILVVHGLWSRHIEKTTGVKLRPLML